MESDLSEDQKNLLIAAYEGNLILVRQLVGSGVGIDAKDSMDGAGPLHLACAGGHLPIAKYFFEELNVDLESVTNDGATPLCLAVSDGMLHVVQYLVEKGANPSHRLAYGTTPLILACIRGHLEIVKFLVEHCKVDVSASTKIGECSLFLAGQEGHYHLVEYLITVGHADVNQERNDGIAPLNNAVWEGHLDIVQLLIKHGAILDGQDFNGQTALHVASEKGSGPMVSTLLWSRAMVDAKDNAGSTPLCVAASRGKLNVAVLLLEAGANPAESGWNGNTPLHLACWCGHQKVVSLLQQNISAEAWHLMINKKNCFGYTPLHLAAAQAHFRLLIFLLDNSSPDLEARNCQGFTVLDYILQELAKAEVVETDETVELLSRFFARLPAQDQESCVDCSTSLQAQTEKLEKRPSIIQEIINNETAATSLQVLQPFLGSDVTNEGALFSTGKPPCSFFLEDASQFVSGLTFENILLLSRETVLNAGHIPNFWECEANNWHWKAADTCFSDKVLFVSHAWESDIYPDTSNRQYTILQSFLLDENGSDIAWIYITFACITQDKLSHLYQIQRLNLLTSLWRATDLLIIPKLTEVPCLFKANQVLWATNLSHYVSQAWGLLETLSSMLTNTRVFCSFQVGESLAFRMFERPQGGSSSLGFHQAYLDVWDQFISQSREDMLEADCISLRKAWKVVEPCRLLGLLANLAERIGAGGAARIHQSVRRLAVCKEDIEYDATLKEAGCTLRK